MGTNLLKIAVLSSSRADYGIYLPLIEKLAKDEEVCLELIAFGTHLSKFHGYTINNIDTSKFHTIHELEHILANDSPNAICTSYGVVALKFADFWKNHTFDVVICLGDRFEMAAAVMSGLPFGIKFAHIHGGETTLGAIDNVYRHAITLASDSHFVTTEKNKNKVISLLESDRQVYNVGSLSLDNLKNMELLSKEDFQKKWGIDLNKKTILITVHPETVAFDQNVFFADEMFKTLSILANERQLVVTMPNADTSGSIFREKLLELKNEFPNEVILIENFGTQSYFTCMKYAEMLFGNSSSGIIEAATFGKFVINIGDRQKGRECDENILHVPFESVQIIEKTRSCYEKTYSGKNSYFNGGAVDKIVQYLKQNYA